MLEIDVTEFFKKENTRCYANSIARSGNPNVGRDTWNNAKQATPLLSSEQVEAARDYFGEMVSEWKTLPDNEIQALFIQELSHRIQELEDYQTGPYAFNWREYRKDERNGRISGGMFKYKNRLYIGLYY